MTRKCHGGEEKMGFSSTKTSRLKQKKEYITNINLFIIEIVRRASRCGHEDTGTVFEKGISLWFHELELHVAILTTFGNVKNKKRREREEPQRDLHI
jgi:hypothetical protein